MKFAVSSGQTHDALEGLSVIEEEEKSDVQSSLANGRGLMKEIRIKSRPK